MRVETIVIVQRDSKILLGLKQSEKKFGGKWNGFGGGLEEKENLEECVIRETRKEGGITPKNLNRLGKILFHFLTDEQDHEVHIYRADDYEGVLDTSKDFVEYKEFSLQELGGIYNNMMPADRFWIPYFVSGKIFGGEVYLDKKDGKFILISHTIKEIENLD